MNSQNTLINSAVLVPIYLNSKNRLRLICIRRSSGGIHGGQLAFPGGKHEDSDNSFAFTALRETQEEIGLAPGDVRILSELSPIETKSTGFRIFPFLGLIKPGDWVVDEREVAEVIDLDLEALADPAMYGEETIQYDSWPTPRLISYYRIGKYKLWGASFRILHPILPDLLAGKYIKQRVTT